MNADVVVVGGGPAGSTVAGIAASEGLRVVVLEKEPEVGRSPCAGYLGCMDFPDVDRGVVQSRIRGMRTFFPSGRYVDFPINGFNVNRTLFDQELASNAVRCGAEFRMNSEVVGLVEKDGRYSGVEIVGGDEIDARVLVGADGASSVISKLLGFRNDVAVAVQYEVSGCKIDPGINEIYFDVEYAPGCYVWVFPTGRDSARVGLAVRSHLVEKNAVGYLDAFIGEHPKASRKFMDSSRKKLIAGLIPVGGLCEKISRDNILLIGDSAGMTDPVTGAGISYSMLAARIAARVVVKAIKEDDVSIVEDYELCFRRMMDRHYARALEKRKLLDSFRDNKSLERNLREVWVTFREYWRELG